jgi:hypothetical protein
MTSCISPSLSALLLPQLLLLLLASSVYEQVRAVCALSGAAAFARRRRATVAKVVKNAFCFRRILGVGAARAPPRWWFRLAVAAMQCLAIRVSAQRLQTSAVRCTCQ